MSRTVWKFRITPKTDIDLPMGWQVVNVGAQGDDAFAWILLDPSLPKHRERFVAIPTGVDVPDGSDHVGSWHMEAGALLMLCTVHGQLGLDGPLVFHLFVLSGGK